MADTFVILDHVQFEKNSFTNRNKILQPDGRAMWLTVPVETKNDSKQSINKVEVNKRVHWQNKHLRSFTYSYSKTPYWDSKEYGHAAREMFRLLDVMDYQRLVDVLSFSFVFLSKMLGLGENWKFSSAYDPPLTEVKSDLVLEICKREDADVYFSGSQGKGYLEEEKFKEVGIEIVYQDYFSLEYKQYQTKDFPFVPDLSVIDLLMNHGPESKEVIMRGNFRKEALK